MKIRKIFTKVFWMNAIEFFNTKLGLWLLTFVFLSVIPFFSVLIYDCYQACKKDRAEIVRLDNEIQSRLSYLATNWKYHSSNRLKLLNALKYISRPNQADYAVHVYTEYEKNTLLSLLWQQHTLVPNNEKDEIRSAIDSAAKLMVIYHEQQEFYRKVEAAQANQELDLQLQKLHELDNKGNDGQLKLMDKMKGLIPDLVKVFANNKLSDHDFYLIKNLNLKRWGEPFDGLEK